MIVLLMDLEMLCKLVDPLREQRDLNLWRPGIAFVGLEITYYLFFYFFS